MAGTKIFIREDFPKEIDERRSTLYPIMKAARAANMQATLISDKLHVIIDSRKYTVDTLDLQPQSLATRNKDNAVLFYGRQSCFSNFFDAQLTINGITYCNSEQYFQNQRALRSGDEGAAKEIMETDDPILQHKLGKKVKVNQGQWNNEIAKAIMEDGVKAKFEQNKKIKDILIATGCKLLLVTECNRNDKFWGNSLAIGNVDADNKSKWLGENAMGQVLINIREILK